MKLFFIESSKSIRWLDKKVQKVRKKMVMMVNQINQNLKVKINHHQKSKKNKNHKNNQNLKNKQANKNQRKVEMINHKYLQSYLVQLHKRN